MHYVITDDGKRLDCSPVAYTPAQLQQFADDAGVGVYVVDGERTGQSADPRGKLDTLVVIAIDGATIWAIAEDPEGWRFLYRAEIGNQFEIVGDNMTGILADCPGTVADKFWNLSD